MPRATGWFRVETEIDIADYDGEYDIEFDNLEDIIETADANNYTKEEIVDYCFESGLDMINYMRTSCNIPELIKLLDAVVSQKIQGYKDIIENRNDLINTRGDRIKELEEQLKKLKEESDEEAVKNVAY